MVFLYIATGNILTIFLSGFYWLRVIIVSSIDPECDAYATAFISEIETPYWSLTGFFLAHHYARVELNVTDSTIDTMYNAIKYEGRSMFFLVCKCDMYSTLQDLSDITVEVPMLQKFLNFFDLSGLRITKDLRLSQGRSQGGCHGCMCTPLFKKKNQKKKPKTISFVG